MKITIVDWGDNVDKEKLIFDYELIIDYGFVSPTLEEQLNKYGFTLGDKAELMERLKNAMLLLYIHDVLTESQELRAMERLHNIVIQEIEKV